MHGSPRLPCFASALPGYLRRGLDPLARNRTGLTAAAMVMAKDGHHDRFTGLKAQVLGGYLRSVSGGSGLRRSFRERRRSV